MNLNLQWKPNLCPLHLERESSVKLIDKGQILSSHEGIFGHASWFACLTVVLKSFIVKF